MSYNVGFPVAAVVLVAGTLYLGSRAGAAPHKANEIPVEPTAETWIGTRSHDDRPYAELNFISPSGDHCGISLYADGVYQLRSQAERNAGSPSKWKIEYTKHRYPVDYATDLGGWIGVRVGVAANDRYSSKGDNGWDTGVRYSPVRYLYGVVAPDLLISARQAGVGVSLYPPDQWGSEAWRHVGLGLGYLVDYRGGTGWSPYLSFSTRF